MDFPLMPFFAKIALAARSIGDLGTTKNKVMMQKVVGNYRLFCAGFVDIFSEKEIPLDKVLVMF